jgi:prepilin-type N-terminal cleavage/methylation domain-containing protein
MSRTGGGTTAAKGGEVFRRRPAFTLVEILIVVIILAILSAIAIPQFMDATTQASMANLKENLSKIRAHIQVYRNQHARYPDGDEVGLQLTFPTDFQGDVVAARDPTHIYGPYLEQMPANPISNSRTVRATSVITERFSPPSTDGGWWYNSATGEFRADLTDHRAGEDGMPYNQY